ncbi:MAG: tetratricopeptide repeat protein, partial [Actinomycetota bacterium]
TAEMVGDALPPNSTLRDLGVHRLRDIVEPQQIFEVSHPDLPAIDTPLRTLSARPNNLPVQPTSFVGRDREMTDLKSRVLGGVPLISVVGPGGCGKTRLAVEVASQLLSEYPDGVWLVDLAQIASDDLVAQAVADALEVQEEQGRDLDVTLRSRLRMSKALLVIDNCEHVVDGAAAFVDRILRSCERVQVLATSREALSVEGETTWSVPPLSVASKGGETVSSDAMRLFVDRAEAMNPRLELTPDDTRAVSEICRRLDGIPLALELAAARVDVLSITQICARLDDRFSLLTQGARSAMPRQRTLRALVDWSYDLLDDIDRVLLSRLGVFAGGFTLEAAEAVVGGEPIAPIDVLEGLTGVVRRSLVQVDNIDGDHRYRLLETIRQYALEKLEERGEALEVRAQHRRWLGELAASTRDRDFVGAATHDALELETGNIRAAISSALSDPGTIGDALRICGDLGYFWWLRGHLSEGESWIAATLDHPEATDPVMRGHLLVWRGLLALERLQLDDAIPPLEEALALGEEYGDPVLKARGITWLGASLTMRGENERARAVLDRRFEVGEDVVGEPERAGWFYLLGTLFQIHGDTEGSSLYLERSMELARKIRASYVLGRALPVAASQALESGDVEGAKKLYQEALDMARETNDRVALARSLVFLAEASLETGDFAGAEEQLREATPIITLQIGFPALTARLEVARGGLDVARGRLVEARDHLETGLQIASEVGRDRVVVDALAALAAVDVTEGDGPSATERLTKAGELARRLNDPDRPTKMLEALARGMANTGDADRASELEKIASRFRPVDA